MSISYNFLLSSSQKEVSIKQESTAYPFSDPRAANDAIYLKKELEEMEELYDDNNIDDEKNKIILQAAEKLADKYPDNLSSISSILCKFWASDIRHKETKEIISHAKMSRNYIATVLPAEYKREYKKQKKESSDPNNLFEEAIRRIADICKDLSHVYTEMYDHVKELETSEDQKDQQILKEIKNDFEQAISHDFHQKVMDKLKKQMFGIKHLDDYIIFLKEIEAAVVSLKHLFDKRRKFSTAAKIVLRMIFQLKLYDDVAKKLNANKKYGAKWLGTIQNDPHLSKFIKLVQCPNCQFNFDRWIEEAEARHSIGLAPQMIDDTFCNNTKK